MEVGLYRDELYPNFSFGEIRFSDHKIDISKDLWDEYNRVGLEYRKTQEKLRVIYDEYNENS